MTCEQARPAKSALELRAPLTARVGHKADERLRTMAAPLGSFAGKPILTRPGLLLRLALD